MNFEWSGLSKIKSKRYTCGFCSCLVGPDQGFSASGTPDGEDGYIYICTYCGMPTFSHGDGLYPRAVPGNSVSDVPPDINNLYEEARLCVMVEAYTASVMANRKILMNIAVDKGAKPKDTFQNYVNYLVDEGFVPPNGKDWVDHIRKKGGEANHEIKLMNQEDAETLIVFTEMLLKFIYEFPNKVPSKTP